MEIKSNVDRMHGAISAIKRHLGTRMRADSLIIHSHNKSGADNRRIEEIWFWRGYVETKNRIICYINDGKYVYESFFPNKFDKERESDPTVTYSNAAELRESHNFPLAFIFGEQRRRVNDDTQSKRERKQGEELFGHVQDASRRRGRACVTKTLAIQTVETKKLAELRIVFFSLKKRNDFNRLWGK